METLIKFNGVLVLLTTGQQLSEVQSYADVADIIISIYPADVRVLRAKPGTKLDLLNGALWCEA